MQSIRYPIDRCYNNYINLKRTFSKQERMLIALIHWQQVYKYSTLFVQIVTHINQKMHYNFETRTKDDNLS